MFRIALMLTVISLAAVLVGCPGPQSDRASKTAEEGGLPASGAGQPQTSEPSYSSGVSQVDEEAPDFALTDTAGNEITRDDFRGRVLVLDFWATWCEPCKDKLKKYEPIVDKYRDQGVELLAVSLDSRPEVAAGWATKNNLPFTVVMMTDQLKADYFPEVGGDVKIPEVRIIDRDGNLRFKLDAKSTVEDMELALAELVAESVGGDESVSKELLDAETPAKAAPADTAGDKEGEFQIPPPSAEETGSKL
jgi:peroxiredoxin